MKKGIGIGVFFIIIGLLFLLNNLKLLEEIIKAKNKVNYALIVAFLPFNVFI